MVFKLIDDLKTYSKSMYNGLMFLDHQWAQKPLEKQLKTKKSSKLTSEILPLNKIL